MRATAMACAGKKRKGCPASSTSTMQPGAGSLCWVFPELSSHSRVSMPPSSESQRLPMRVCVVFNVIICPVTRVNTRVEPYGSFALSADIFYPFLNRLPANKPGFPEMRGVLLGDYSISMSLLAGMLGWNDLNWRAGGITQAAQAVDTPGSDAAVGQRRLAEPFRGGVFGRLLRWWQSIHWRWLDMHGGHGG